MEEMWMRFITDMGDRITGPFKFRLVMHPVMSVVLAALAGLKDAHAGKPPYFWALATHPEHRREMLQDGWKSIGKLATVAIILDVIYQYITMGFVYPGETLVVVLVLAIIPYLLVRGQVTRIEARRRR